jgi:DNA (cytosine-5)-methyltransferase 1
MPEINALPWNGLRIASTFSGAGGSCLGYRMAGFKVVWANEFVPAAQDSYRANMTSDCILDPRDIHGVKAEDILRATGLKVGDLDLFDGSPPCQAFSTAGKREKGWGKGKRYEHGAVQKNEQLFEEYIRLLRGLKPRTFVAENVSGLVKGTAKGYFLEILAALKASGYRVRCKVLDAKWLGVPQSRQRTIFVGVREDLGIEPVHPRPLHYFYSVRDALPWISEVRQTDVFNEPDRVTTDAPSPSVTLQGLGAKRHSSVSVEMIIGNKIAGQPIWGSVDHACPTIVKQGPHYGSGEVRTQTERRKFTIAELKRICAFPDDFILTGSYAQQWERLGNSVPPVMMRHIAETIRDEVLLRMKRP